LAVGAIPGGWRRLALTVRSDVAPRTKKPAKLIPAGLLVENEIMETLKLLHRIVVKISVKVKITVVRK
jgi:hypothetical protein